MDTENLMTIKQAAKELGVSENAIRNATLDGRLPFVAMFSRKLIQRADVEAYRRRSQPDGVKLRGRPRRMDRKQKATDEVVEIAK